MTKRRNFIKATSLIVASAGTMGYQAVYSGNKSLTNRTKKESGMLQHNVYFWLKEEVTVPQIKAFEQGMKDFVAAVKEVKKAEIGIPADTEEREVTDHTFGYSLFVSFKTLEDHNIYQEHPAHKKFIDDFSDLWARVRVYDSKIL